MNRASRLASHRILMLLILALLPVVVLLIGRALQERNKLPDYQRGDAGVSRAILDFLTDRVAQPLQTLEWRMQNYVHSHATPAPSSGELLVLGIDDATQQLKSAFPEDVEASKALQLIQKGWPFTRGVYAETVAKLLDAGAKAVFLDLMFTGPSSEHPEGDEDFKKALQKYSGKVLLAANFTNAIGNSETLILQKPWEGFSPDVNPPPDYLGFINVFPDNDQVVRWARFHRSMRNEDANRPDLAHLDQMHSIITAMLKALGKPEAAPADDARHYVRFGHPAAYAPLSLHEIFIPDMWESNFQNGAVFKDKVILIGNVTPHAQDYHMTPIGRMSGVEIHAHVMSAALTHEFLNFVPLWVSLASIPVAGLLAWALIAFVHRPFGNMFALIAVSLGIVLLSQQLFDRWNLIFEGVAPMLAFNVAGLLGLSYDFMLERRQRRQLGSYLQRYFSPDVVALMLKEPEHFRSLQGGDKRTITVLFSDLRGFTTLSETMPPQQVVTQLNQYFTRMVAVIHGHSGGIDKFIGDAIMAVWGWVGRENTPDNIRKDAVEAVRTILRMRECMSELNAQWRTEERPELAFGLGIHTGEALVGDLGSEKQSGFTVMGDTVNTASRLEGTTKEYGVDNVISDTVWELVKNQFICRSTDWVKPKGKHIPVPIYTVMKEGAMARPDGLDAYEEGVILYRKGEFTAARDKFRQAINEGLDDYLTRTVYLARCEALIEHPPESWDGVYVMTKK